MQDRFKHPSCGPESRMAGRLIPAVAATGVFMNFNSKNTSLNLLKYVKNPMAFYLPEPYKPD